MASSSWLTTSTIRSEIRSAIAHGFLFFGISLFLRPLEHRESDERRKHEVRPVDGPRKMPVHLLVRDDRVVPADEAAGRHVVRADGADLLEPLEGRPGVD